MYQKKINSRVATMTRPTIFQRINDLFFQCFTDYPTVSGVFKNRLLWRDRGEKQGKTKEKKILPLPIAPSESREAQGNDRGSQRGTLQAMLSSYIAGKKIKHNLSWWKENSADLKVPNMHYSLSTIVNKSDTTKLNTAIEKVNYL